MASNEIIMESAEEKNKKLEAEMANMKKKIMVAMKKQQAELLAKVQAAERERNEALERARIAEAGAATPASENDVDVAALQNQLQIALKDIEEMKTAHVSSIQQHEQLVKAKEDMEVQLLSASQRVADVMSEKALLQEAADQAYRTNQHVRDALKSMSKEADELRRALDAKELALSESRKLAAAKEQAMLELASKVDEEREAKTAAQSLLEERFRKTVEDHDEKLAEVTKEWSRASQTVGVLQAQLAEKEQKLAEVEAKTSGELVRLAASLESARGDLTRAEEQQAAEREAWEAAMGKLGLKADAAETALQLTLASAAASKAAQEAELEEQRRQVGDLQAALAARRQEASQVAAELAAYKVRAHALLQRKQAELDEAKDSQMAAAQEAALQEAKEQALRAVEERDRIALELREALESHQAQLSARNEALQDAEQRIRDSAARQEALRAQLASQAQAWQARLDEEDATWRAKFWEVEKRARNGVDTQAAEHLSSLQAKWQALQAEFDSFREMAGNMMEAKDVEISRLLEDNARMQAAMAALPQKASLEGDGDCRSAPATAQGGGGPGMAPEAVAAAAEQQILVLARQQAQREEEVAQCRRHIQALQDELADLETQNTLRAQQEMVLKEELRNMDRSQKRGVVDMTYLKNVVLKLLQTGDSAALLPVLAMLLQFSPEETKRCHESREKL